MENYDQYKGEKSMKPSLRQPRHQSWQTKKLREIFINMLKIMEAMFKELKKDMTIMCHQTGNINKELDIIKKIEIPRVGKYNNRNEEFTQRRLTSD